MQFDFVQVIFCYICLQFYFLIIFVLYTEEEQLKNMQVVNIVHEYSCVYSGPKKNFSSKDNLLLVRILPEHIKLTKNTWLN